MLNNPHYIVTHRQLSDWLNDPNHRRAYLFGDEILAVTSTRDPGLVDVVVWAHGPNLRGFVATRNNISRQALVRVEVPTATEAGHD